MKFIFFLLAFPFYVDVVAQESNCIINLHVEGNHQAIRAVVMQNEKQLTYQITNNEVKFSLSLEHPNLISLIILYKDWTPRRNIFHLFAAPGVISLTATKDKDSVEYLKVEGPELTIEYQTKLEEPVFKYGLAINKLRDKLKNGDNDSLVIKSKLADLLSHSYEIPRNYINKNPNSLLDITALSMMGDGDPTSPNPQSDLAKLFHSISYEIQNTDEGKAYSVFLKTLLDNGTPN